MTRNVWNILFLITAVTAFAPARPAATRTVVRHMFNPEPEKAATAAKLLEEVSPLQEVNALETAVTTSEGEESTETKTVLKDLATGEVKEVAWVR